MLQRGEQMKLIAEQYHLDKESQIVYVRGSWPLVIGLERLCAKQFPGYELNIVSWDRLKELKGG
jgi:hypothetical protein